MKINPHIFRAYDIRGIYGKDLNEEVFWKIGFVLGKNKEKFVVGNDIRESGKNLSRALIGGILKAGSDVIYVGTAPFGQVLFSGSELKVDKTLFVTASHLPLGWNGLKPCFGDGEPFSKEKIEEIRNEVIEIKDDKIGNIKEIKLEEVNLKDKYFEILFSKFPLLKNNNLKIVLDCGNGAMSLTVPKLFKRMGFQTIELFCFPDSSFPNRTSEPTFEATQKLRERVLREKADFGVAFDGDGDRGVIIDEKGNYLNGNQIGIILGKDIVPDSKNKKVIKTVACSLAVEEELKCVGAEIIEVPVGHTHVVSACKKEKACLGIEESSHIVMPQYFLFDDAILIPLKIAEIILKEKKKLSEMVSEIKIYPFEEIVFSCPDEIKFEAIKKLEEDFKKNYKEINTLDGIKINFNDGWILIRPSNTSPKIRLYIEAKTKEKLDSLKEKFIPILEKICKPR